NHETQSSSATLALLVALLGGFALTLADPAHAACTKEWAAAADGFWSVGGNWSPPGAPTNADDVCITLDGTYTGPPDTNGVTHTLTLGGMAGTQTLAIPGGNRELDIGADSSIGSQGVLTMAGASGYSLLYLATHTLDNAGTIRTLPGGADARRFINAGT